MTDQKRWYSWVIKRNRFENVVSFIKDSVPEVDKYFYPQIKKEYQTKRGTRVRDIPLYEGYIFLRYHNADAVFHKLSSYPFITTFAGSVSEEEIQVMENAQGKLFSEIKTRRFSPGDTVTLLSGPFKGFDALVEGAEGDQVKVRIDAKILGQTGIELAFSEDQVERKAELQNAGVQDI
jgi:transcription antitermination factor NusG